MSWQAGGFVSIEGAAFAVASQGNCSRQEHADDCKIGPVKRPHAEVTQDGCRRQGDAEMVYEKAACCRQLRGTAAGGLHKKACVQLVVFSGTALTGLNRCRRFTELSAGAPISIPPPRAPTKCQINSFTDSRSAAPSGSTGANPPDIILLARCCALLTGTYQGCCAGRKHAHRGPDTA